jgi:hypothetical protein
MHDHPKGSILLSCLLFKLAQLAHRPREIDAVLQQIVAQCANQFLMLVEPFPMFTLPFGLLGLVPALPFTLPFKPSLVLALPFGLLGLVLALPFGLLGPVLPLPFTLLFKPSLVLALPFGLLGLVLSLPFGLLGLVLPLPFTLLFKPSLVLSLPFGLLGLVLALPCLMFCREPSQLGNRLLQKLDKAFVVAQIGSNLILH